MSSSPILQLQSGAPCSDNESQQNGRVWYLDVLAHFTLYGLARFSGSQNRVSYVEKKITPRQGCQNTSFPAQRMSERTRLEHRRTPADVVGFISHVCEITSNMDIQQHLTLQRSKFPTRASKREEKEGGITSERHDAFRLARHQEHFQEIAANDAQASDPRGPCPLGSRPRRLINITNNRIDSFDIIGCFSDLRGSL